MSHATIYVTDWCPYCASLLRGLQDTEVELIDVDADPEAGEWVKSVNDGNRIVPTVRYSDGSHATNPPASAVKLKIGELSA